jgi:hypothetical protein
LTALALVGAAVSLALAALLVLAIPRNLPPDEAVETATSLLMAAALFGVLGLLAYGGRLAGLLP